MPKQSKKQKVLFNLSLGKKRVRVTKPRLQWTILIVLVLSMVAAQISGLYPFIYGYSLCHDKPLEITGKYYRIPYDDTYGIHMGSDYSRCFDGLPTGMQRDPKSKAGARMLKEATDKTDFTGIDGYTVYVPEGYKIENLSKQKMGDAWETNFTVASGAASFNVREMKQGTINSDYTDLCSKPATERWSGEIVGHDSQGRAICRTLSYYYPSDYIVGINIGDTSIMLQTRLTSSVETLNDNAASVFSVLKSYSK